MTEARDGNGWCVHATGTGLSTRRHTGNMASYPVHDQLQRIDITDGIG